jgi:hypothetical protein
MSYAAISPCSIRLRVTSYNELADHAWYTQEQHTGEVNEDEGSATVLTSHKRKAPHVTQTYSRACCRQHYRQSATEIASLCHHYQSLITKGLTDAGR